MKHCVLDSSFVIDLLNEIADGRVGPAKHWLKRNLSARLWITPVTLAEVVEGAENPESALEYLGRYSWQGTAAGQPRVERERDEAMGAILVGHDGAAFQRLGAAYDDHWQ